MFPEILNEGYCFYPTGNLFFLVFGMNLRHFCEIYLNENRLANKIKKQLRSHFLKTIQMSCCKDVLIVLLKNHKIVNNL